MERIEGGRGRRIIMWIEGGIVDRGGCVTMKGNEDGEIEGWEEVKEESGA